MKYLAGNLKKLKYYNRNVYEKIKSSAFADDDFFDDRFNIAFTKDGDKTIEVFCNKNENIRLNSIYSPEKEADRWVGRFAGLEKITSLIMFGYGSGMFFDKLKNKMHNYKHIYIYEPDINLFVFILKNFDLNDILNNERIKFFVKGINDKDLYVKLCSKTNWAMLPTQLVCCHPVYDKLYEKEYKKFGHIIEEYRYALKISENTSIKCAKKFTLNTLRNLEFVKNSNYLGEFIGKIDKKIPVIIVSAGPSLDKNISELKKAEKKSIILATDSAVKSLIEYKINFDAIVTIDGNKYIEKFDEKYCENIPVFTIPDAKYELLKSNKGRKIWITGQGFYVKLYEKYGYKFPKYLAGGSVATAAFSIAKILGTQTIIMIGQDLAYKGDITHSGHRIIEDTESESSSQPTIYIDGINGDKVKSKPDWLKYLQWFENVISQMGNEVRVIDATEGGAKINGTKVMKLADAIADYCESEFDFQNFIENFPVTFSEEEYKEFAKDILQIIKELDVVYNASLYGKNMVERMFQNLNSQNFENEDYANNFKLIKEMQAIIQKQTIYILLDEYISSDIADRLKIAAKNYLNKYEEEYERVKSLKILFESLINAVKDLKPVVEFVAVNM